MNSSKQISKMCKKKPQSSDLDEMETDTDSDTPTDRDGDSMESEQEAAGSDSKEEAAEDEESEDEVIKAIKRECERKNDHPPMIVCEDFITDISFHPHTNILGVATIVGDVTFYKYGMEENSVQSKWF